MIINNTCDTGVYNLSVIVADMNKYYVNSNSYFTAVKSSSNKDLELSIRLVLNELNADPDYNKKDLLNVIRLLFKKLNKAL